MWHLRASTCDDMHASSSSYEEEDTCVAKAVISCHDMHASSSSYEEEDTCGTYTSKHMHTVYARMR